MTRWLAALLMPVLLTGCITIHTEKPLLRDELTQAGLFTMYDNRLDMHVVQMRHVPLRSDYTDGELLFQAFTRGKGLTIARPDKVSVMITASGLHPERLDPIPTLSLSYDGKTVTVPVVHEAQGVISGICVSEVTLAQFQAMAKARRFTGRLGAFSFTADEPVKRRMQALVEALTTPQPEPQR